MIFLDKCRTALKVKMDRHPNTGDNAINLLKENNSKNKKLTYIISRDIMAVIIFMAK